MPCSRLLFAATERHVHSHGCEFRDCAPACFDVQLTDQTKVEAIGRALQDSAEYCSMSLRCRASRWAGLRGAEPSYFGGGEGGGFDVFFENAR